MAGGVGSAAISTYVRVPAAAGKACSEHGEHAGDGWHALVGNDRQHVPAAEQGRGRAAGEGRQRSEEWIQVCPAALAAPVHKWPAPLPLRRRISCRKPPPAHMPGGTTLLLGGIARLRRLPVLDWMVR